MDRSGPRNGGRYNSTPERGCSSAWQSTSFATRGSRVQIPSAPQNPLVRAISGNSNACWLARSRHPWPHKGSTGLCLRSTSFCARCFLTPPHINPNAAMRCRVPVPRVRPNGGVAGPRFARGSHSHRSSSLVHDTPSVGRQLRNSDRRATVDGSQRRPGWVIRGYLASA